MTYISECYSTNFPFRKDWLYVDLKLCIYRSIFIKWLLMYKNDFDALTIWSNYTERIRLLFTVRSRYFQLRQKVPWTFLLLGSLYTWDNSESAKKNICHQASKRVIFKKQVFYTEICILTAFFSHVYDIKFCKAWWQIFFLTNSEESCIHIKAPKAKKVHGKFGLGWKYQECTAKLRLGNLPEKLIKDKL